MVGVIIFYVGSCSAKVVIEAEKSVKTWFTHKEWYAKKLFSCTRLSSYALFLYELYHHYSDIFYIIRMPHWNSFVALVLLVSFWLPLTVPLLAAFDISQDKEGSLTTYSQMFVSPTGSSLRKMSRLVATNAVHLTF